MTIFEHKQNGYKFNNQQILEAMSNAIYANALPKVTQKKGDKLLFNGFWRKGTKQNVCAWLDKGTWHDIKTGRGGNCSDFAKEAFNLTLPEFVNRYSYNSSFSTVNSSKEDFTRTKQITTSNINLLWNNLLRKDLNRENLAAIWLENQRGIKDPNLNIGSGFVNLLKEDVLLFDTQHRSLIKHRTSLGHNMLVPLRSTLSDKVTNIFIRLIRNQTETISKDSKSRLLNDCGGWGSKDEPRAFGFPHLIHDFPNLIICEGMADYFAAEYLLDTDEKYLPIGVANASSLLTWAEWLSKNKYNGSVTIVFQLDKDKQGNLSKNAIGQKNAVSCLKYLQQNKISAQLFRWSYFFRLLSVNDLDSINDLADICNFQRHQPLVEIFQKTLRERFRHD